MTMELFGYMALCDYMKGYSPVYYWLMDIAAVIMFISLPLHHTICCLSEWFFVKLKLTREALEGVWDFFKSTAYTMYIAYLAMIVFSVAFLIRMPVPTNSISMGTPHTKLLIVLFTFVISSNITYLLLCLAKEKAQTSKDVHADLIIKPLLIFSSISYEKNVCKKKISTFGVIHVIIGQ